MEFVADSENGCQVSPRGSSERNKGREGRSYEAEENCESAGKTDQGVLDKYRKGDWIVLCLKEFTDYLQVVVMMVSG